MNGLRWILLVGGLAFIGFVYFFTRYQQSKRGARARRAARTEPELDLFDHLDQRAQAAAPDEDVRLELARMAKLVGERDELPEPEFTVAAVDELDEDTSLDDLAVNDEAEPEAAIDEERLVVLSVMAPSGHPFRGSALRAAFERVGLEFGDMDIYHRMTLVGGRRMPVFSVASAVKPGTFEPTEMENFSTPGISLFLQLPGPMPGVQAFDDLVNTSERLAAELGGVLRDQEHHAVTHQMLMHVRAQITGAGVTPERSAV